jgi:competence protein CoiA
MKFALVDGQRQEAQPGLSGKCRSCEQPMIARCGEVRVWHWAHKRKSPLCDRWWENETEWHRNWKDQFPDHWQEIVHPAENDERHIADVRTDHGWVIEFQHSPIKPEERRARDSFYKKLVWVVNAARLEGDRAQFDKALETGTRIGQHTRRVHLDECRLLRQWSGSYGPIFFDFGGEMLWWLLARRPDEPGIIGPFPRDEFIAAHHGKGPQGARDFDELTTALGQAVEKYNAAQVMLRAASMSRAAPQATGFQQYLARRRIRRRF